ncbi:hypothetical protein AVEN_108791-1 [Araneus ventricosus]|uniref:Uncharacterized protein n=1 Tax=Araneus ventricosus TaxID=182803 RepID=A0A4Y2CD13_ARAVE|nr:hypothetical protein AVEN_108791-1 [Araneus ventricosus]
MLIELTTIEEALESRFGDSHLTQFYRTELKTRRQKPGESLQVFAADVGRLMSLAYVECPLDLRRCYQRRRHAAFNEIDGWQGFEISSGI